LDGAEGVEEKSADVLLDKIGEDVVGFEFGKEIRNPAFKSFFRFFFPEDIKQGEFGGSGSIFPDSKVNWEDICALTGVSSLASPGRIVVFFVANRSF
jgi:hypothetical protein